MSHLSLHVVPRGPRDNSEWERFSVRQKAIRLRSLQVDPTSFSSRYESEVKESMEFWVNRLKDPAAWTVVMVKGPEGLPEDEEVLLREDVQWVAFCVMVDGTAMDKVRLGTPSSITY